MLLVASVGGVFGEEVESEGGERLLLMLVVPQQLQLSDGQHLRHALPHPAEEEVADADDSAVAAAEAERAVESVRAVSRARFPHQLQQSRQSNNLKQASDLRTRFGRGRVGPRPPA